MLSETDNGYIFMKLSDHMEFKDCSYVVYSKAADRRMKRQYGDSGRRDSSHVLEQTRGALCCTGTDYPTVRRGSFVIESDDRSEALERRSPSESSHVATDDTRRDLYLCDAIPDSHYDRSSDNRDC